MSATVDGAGLVVTRHPLQRAGAWAVAELAGRSEPEAVSREDCGRVAQRVVEDVCVAACAAKEAEVYDWWKVLFALYPNSKATHSKRSRDRAVLKPDIEALFAADGESDRWWPCAFCTARTATVWTKSSLPLFDTNKALNTLPPGVEGWPVCQGCRLAVWALPYGAWVTAGSATVLTCEQDEVERRFVRQNVLRARRIMQAGFGKQPSGRRPEREVLAALRVLGGDLPAASTLWHFKNDNQEPWLRVSRSRRATPRFVARVEGNAPLRRAWWLMAKALTHHEKSGVRTVDGRTEAARALFEAEDGQGRSLLVVLYRLLLLPRERPWLLHERADLTRLAFDYAKEILGMNVEATSPSPVATLLADWIEHGSGSPRGRLAEYRSVALTDRKLGELLMRAHFRMVLDGRVVTAGPDDWAPLIQQRPRAWEQRMLLAASVLQTLQQRGVMTSERPAPQDQGDERLDEAFDQPIFNGYDDEEGPQ